METRQISTEEIIERLRALIKYFDDKNQRGNNGREELADPSVPRN